MRREFDSDGVSNEIQGEEDSTKLELMTAPRSSTIRP